MKNRFREIIEDTPIIAAIKNEEGLKECLKTKIQIIFVLYGDICNINDIVSKIKEKNKIAIVHMDLIQGLSSKEIALEYIKNNTKADGIITTKHTLIKRAKELGLYTVLRYFVVDSMALSNIEKQTISVYPDVIEILPGIMPKIIKHVNEISKVPVIAGGMISKKEDVITALSNGAMAISSTNYSVWLL